MDNKFISSSQDLPDLVKSVGNLQQDIVHANFTNIRTLQKIDAVLDRLTLLDINAHLMVSPGRDIGSISRYSLRQTEDSIHVNARKAKDLIQKIALKEGIEYKVDDRLLNKVVMLLMKIAISLKFLHAELYSVNNLPLFSFSQRTSNNME